MTLLVDLLSLERLDNGLYDQSQLLRGPTHFQSPSIRDASNRRAQLDATKNLRWVGSITSQAGRFSCWPIVREPHAKNISITDNSLVV